MNTQNRERKNNMIHLRFKEKRSLREISEIYHISRERVRQIIGNTGTGIITKRRRKEILEDITSTNKELAEKLHLTINYISHYRKGIRHQVELNSPIGKGFMCEEWVSKKLTEHEISHTLLPNSSAYDILLSNGIKIDVKCREHPHKDSQGYWRYTVDKRKKKTMPDFYAIVIKEDIYFVPQNFCGCCISIPAESTHIRNRRNKWEQLKNNFSLLSK